MHSFGPPSRILVDYHLEKGVMQLHDAVGVNCEKGATTEIQGAGTWYMYGLIGVCLVFVWAKSDLM